MTYPGGKNGSGTYQKIINLIPPHQIYIEPFLGSGAILRLKRPAPMASIGMDADGKVIKDCEWMRALVPNLTLYTGDAIDYLAKFDTGGTGNPAWLPQADTFVYLDPPYLHETRSDLWLYRYEMTRADHIRLLDVILRLQCMVAISGYESDLYNDYLAGWRKASFNAVTRGGTCRTEVVWMNYPEPLQLHDYRYLGDDYRERERIKRKKDRWTAKLTAMPAQERYAILAAILELAAPETAAPDPDPTAIFDAAAAASFPVACPRFLGMHDHSLSD